MCLRKRAGSPNRLSCIRGSIEGGVSALPSSVDDLFCSCANTLRQEAGSETGFSCLWQRSLHPIRPASGLAFSVPAQARASSNV